MQYRDFEMKLSGNKEAGFFVEVLDAPGLRRSDAAALQVPFDKFGDWQRELKRGGPTPTTTLTLGRRLFDALFPREILRLWESARANNHSGSLLRLRLDIRSTELAIVPWEVIHDGHGYLALTGNTPLVRCLSNHRLAIDGESSLPLNILLVVSTPSNVPKLPNIEAELASIMDSLLRLKKEGKVGKCDVVHHTTRKLLQTQLRQANYHVLHYMGHGEFAGDSGCLVFEDQDGRADKIDADTLSGLVEDKHLCLLFLNACETAVFSSGETFRGVAEASLRVGVPAVIAMSTAVPDHVASDFADTFYKTLVEEHPIEYCITEARKAITTNNSMQWAIPVLFTNAKDSLLWKDHEKGRKDKPHEPSPGMVIFSKGNNNKIAQVINEENTTTNYYDNYKPKKRQDKS
jgi:hypothetical protein